MPRNGSGIYSKPAGTTAVASTTIESAKYNSVIDDLVTDANTPRPVVAGGTGATSLAGLLAAIGGQPLDADLTAIAALGYTSGAYLLKKTAAGTFSLIALTAAGEALLDDANAAAQLVTLGAQPSDQDLTDIAGLTRTRGDLLVGGASAWTDLALGAAGTALVSDGTDPVWGSEGLYFRLNSAHAGANATGAQNLLPANVTVAGSTVYEYEIFYRLLKTAGTTSHNVSISWGGTATLNNWHRQMVTTSNNAADFNNLIGSIGADASQATPINISGTINFADARIIAHERGTFSVNAGGTLIPRYALSAAPGGAYSTAAGALFRLRKLGVSGADNTQGTWA